MLSRLEAYPFFLVLTGFVCLSMLAPAGFALAAQDFLSARTFLYAAFLGLALAVLIGITVSARPREERGRDQLFGLLTAFVCLPALMAVPFQEALQTTSFLNAYVEMVSAFSTTGATLFQPDRLPDALHLWRAQVAWLGGLLIWVAVAAVLAPRALGGFELTSGVAFRASSGGGSSQARRNTAARLARTTRVMAPIYAGLTLTLWVCLLVAGDPPLVAVTHAMSVMSTSGISPIGGLQQAPSGFVGELLIFLFLTFALSRMTFSTDTFASGGAGLGKDPEIRLSAVIILGVTLFLFLRHWLGALDVDDEQNLMAGLRALWGAVFTVLSFLTTTGFESQDWFSAQNWSGLGTTGLILMGLALLGGGVATTAGGVKLLRVFVLYQHGLREMGKMIHPSSVGRSGGENRQIRRQSAFIAWVFFTLFALSIAVVTVGLTLFHVTFETAIVLAVSALSTTGPLIVAASDVPVSLVNLPDGAKLVFAAAMIVGRLETLAIIALFIPDLWRN